MGLSKMIKFGHILLFISVFLGCTLHAQIIATYTTENSDLPDNNVNVIYIDTFGVAWIGTHAGIARMDNGSWEIINDQGDLAGNTVNDMEYERTDSNWVLWVGTNGGVTALTFDTSGVIGSEQFTMDSSGLMNDTVLAVGVDLMHTRWFGTPVGITVYNDSEWDTISYFWNGYGDERMFFSDNPINDIVNEYDTIAYIATNGGGIARYAYDEVDGFVGATTYDDWYSQIGSLNVYTTYFKDSSQYFGTDKGAKRHDSLDIRLGWYTYDELNTLFRVQSIFIDDEDVIWFGTNNGLFTYDGSEWKHFNMEHGLVYKSINDIKTDTNGYKWLATDGGLQVLDSLPSTEGPEPAVIYSIEKSTVDFHAIVNTSAGNLEVLIDFPEEDEISMVLYNLLAQQQMILENDRHVAAGENRFTYDLENYSPGIYLVKMISHQGQFSRKLLLIK
jgi:hypothetical protein